LAGKEETLLLKENPAVERKPVIRKPLLRNLLLEESAFNRTPCC
jgi:hypothetical protein